MATLFVVVSPAHLQADLTSRARRLLERAPLIVAEINGHARRLLAAHQIQTPVVSIDTALAGNALADGDVALLLSGEGAGLQSPVSDFVRKALADYHSVVPIPGPSTALSALVLSGMPSDSFVYVGDLPGEAQARRAMLQTVQSERRTLVLVSEPSMLTAATDIQSAFADRDACLVGVGEQGVEVIWSGAMLNFPETVAGSQSSGPWFWVIGYTAEPGSWTEDRLNAEVRERLSQGLSAKEISRQLTVASGWPRRQIYHKCVQMAKQENTSGGRESASPAGT